MFSKCLLFFNFLFLLAANPCLAQLQTPNQLMDNVQISIVKVHTTNSKSFPQSNGHTVVGTYHTDGLGVIIDSSGLIVTNTHVIANAPNIEVALNDGTVLEGKVVYSSDADFSFIKINPPYPLTAITWADSSQAPVGTSVIVLSNDGGDQEHVLSGQISSLNTGIDSNDIELLGLNITLKHGDSGGPLLDSDGHLLGLIMAKELSQSDQSYAIASNKIQREYQHYQQNIPN